MTLANCPICGEPVRLSALRVRVNRKQGVAHAIVHRHGGVVRCDDEDWVCSMEKPYPKRDEDKPWWQMVKRWNEKYGGKKP